MMMKVELSKLDVKRIREIAKLQGNNRDELTPIDIWGVVNEAIIDLYVKTRHEKKKTKKGDPYEPTPASNEEIKNGGYL